MDTGNALILQSINAPATGFNEFMQHWRFSMSQQHQLQRLLQQWQARSDTAIDIKKFFESKNSKAVIQQLKQALASLPYRFGDA